MTGDQPMAAEMEPVTGPLDQTFCADNLFTLRNAVAVHGAALGLSGRRVADLVLLAHELASNAVRHGGATATVPARLRLWASPDPLAVVCEVTDSGPGLTDPDRAGVEPVEATADDGRGLWIVRQVADVVDIAVGPTGTRITATLLVVC